MVEFVVPLLVALVYVALCRYVLWQLSFAIAYRDLKESIDQLAIAIGRELLPAFQQLAADIYPIVQEFNHDLA